MGSQESVNAPTWIINGFQQRNRQDSKDLNKDTFCRLAVTCAQFVIGTEKDLIAGILLNYDCDDYNQGYGQTKEALTALTKNDILPPHISNHDFRSSNVRADDIGQILYVFDIGCQQNFTAS